MSDPILISPIVAWASGLSVIISLALTIWNIVTSGSRANAKLISHHDAMLADLERRVIRISDHLESLPSISTIHRLELKLTQVVGDLARLDERLKPVSAMAERAQEQLLAQAKRA